MKSDLGGTYLGTWEHLRQVTEAPVPNMPTRALHTIFPYRQLIIDNGGGR